MPKFFIRIILFALFILPLPNGNASSRLEEARRSADAPLRRLFTKNGLSYPPKCLFIRVFKAENVLELWASDNPKTPYRLLKTYDVCSMSGVLGPKHRQGDEQVPEGFYRISQFNPYSAFYLSLKVSYPNAADQQLNPKGNWGGDIYIHGNCVSIGCVAITDPAIKELFWANYQVQKKQIPVHIFPTRLSNFKTNILEILYEGDPELLQFWKNMQKGYQLFENTHIPPEYTKVENGKYIF